MECFFNKLKAFRRVATRYDKLATSFIVFVEEKASAKGGVFNQCCRSCGTSFIDVLCNLQRYNKIVLNLNSGDCYGKKKK